LLKYKSPGVKGSPSLSTDGSLFFCPKYVSSKLSAAARAASLALFAALAALEAVLAKLDELLAKFDELAAWLLDVLAKLEALFEKLLNCCLQS